MIALAVLGGCGKKQEKEKHDEPAATTPAATTPATTTPAKEAPPPVDAAAAPPAAAAKHITKDEAGRGGYGCTFAGFRGNGADKSAWFKITMPDGKAAQASSFQSWVFYYDAKGAQAKRYPHATGYEGEPEKALGVSGPDVAKLEKTTVECEITSVKFKDHTYWMNDNIVPCCSDRPKGGLSDDQLKGQAGEQVAVEVLDGKTGKLKLTNLSDKPIKMVGVKVFHFHDDATYASADQNVEVALAPKASVEKTVELTGPDTDLAEVKATAATALEATAPNVTYDDGTKWSNGNLQNVPQP